MRLIAHIIGKDLRAHRWPLLLWVALFAGQAAFGLAITGLEEVDGLLIDNFKVANSVIVIVQFVVGFVLVTQCVQGDDLAGTRMFWVTRPISGERLLKAKLAEVLLLFAGLPVLALLPWWLHHGFTAEDVGWAAYELVGWQLLMIAPAFLIASLTDDFGRAILWGLLLLAALTAGTITLQRNMANAMRMAVGVVNGEFSRGGGLAFTKLWLLGFFLVAISFTVAIHQFLTRRSLRSMAMAGPLAVVAVLVALWWPWDCSVLFMEAGRPDPFQLSNVPVTGLQLTVPPAEVQEPYPHSRKSPASYVEQTMELRGLSPDLIVQLARFEQTWKWPNGFHPVDQRFGVSSAVEPPLRRALGLGPVTDDPETKQWLQERYGERLARGLPVWSTFAVWKETGDRKVLIGRTTLNDSVIARLRSRPATAEARVEIFFSHPRVLGEFPLRAGARWSGKSGSVRVGELGKRGGGAVMPVQVVLGAPGVRWQGLWLARGTESGVTDPFQRNLVAVNRRNQTLDWTWSSGERSRSGRVAVGGVILKWQTLNVRTGQVIRDGQWVPRDPDWPEHTTLAVMDFEPAGRFTQKLKTEKYELKARQPDKNETKKPGDRL